MADAAAAAPGLTSVARDSLELLDALGIGSAGVFGISAEAFAFLLG